MSIFHLAQNEFIKITRKKAHFYLFFPVSHRFAGRPYYES